MTENPAAVASPRALSVMGVTAHIRATGAETGGAYSIMEHVFPPGTGPAFLHLHPAQETLLIHEGRFEIYSKGVKGKEARKAGPGDVHHVGSKVPHGLKNVGTETGRAFIVFHPADLQERFFVEFDALFSHPPGPPDAVRLEALFAKHGLVLLEKPPAP